MKWSWKIDPWLIMFGVPGVAILIYGCVAALRT